MYMNLTQEAAMKRVSFLKDEVSACEFHGSPCPLLWSQLIEAEVLVDRLLTAIHAAREHLEKDCE